jgi:hypothetical protein
VWVKGLSGEALANALMKAETKAKRRATLSICGLGMLDETEVEDVPGVRLPAPPAQLDYSPPKASTAAVAAAPAPAAVTPTPPTSVAPPAAEELWQATPKGKADLLASAGGVATALAAGASKVTTVVDTDAPMIDSPQRVAQINKIRRMMIDVAPTGLAWHPKHAEAWLTRYFGQSKPIKLTLGQASDVEMLLRARMKIGPVGTEEYARLLEMFHAEGRVLTAEVGE